MKTAANPGDAGAKAKNRQRGTSLLEVMVGLSLFAIGATGTIAAFTAATKQVGVSRLYGIAAAALRSEGETVMLTAYPNLGPVAASGFTPGGLLSGEHTTFQKTWAVTENVALSRKTVVVTVSWTTSRGTSSVSDTFQVSQ